MRILTIILTFLLLTISELTLACDCDSQGEFLTVAPESELVALVQVNEYLTFKEIYDEKTPMSMQVEVISIFKGEESRKTFTVWGDNGALCRPYLSRFEIDKFYVIAFQKGEDGSESFVHSNERPTDYSISICGDYWLTADNETKIATGAVSKTQNSIGFGSLWEHFKGDKTKELSPIDFKQIFQLALDLPTLQQYFHTDKDSKRKQIIIQHFGDANHNDLQGVTKFDRQVTILTEKEIKNQGIEFYFVLGDWVCGKDFVRMQLSYVGEGLTASYVFRKDNNNWTIDNSEIWEE